MVGSELTGELELARGRLAVDWIGERHLSRERVSRPRLRRERDRTPQPPAEVGARQLEIGAGPTERAQSVELSRGLLQAALAQVDHRQVLSSQPRLGLPLDALAPQDGIVL